MTVLVGIALGVAAAAVAGGAGVSPSTVNAWLRAFRVVGMAGLQVH